MPILTASTGSGSGSLRVSAPAGLGQADEAQAAGHGERNQTTGQAAGTVPAHPGLLHFLTPPIGVDRQ